MIFLCYMCRLPEMFVVEAVEGGAKVVSHHVHMIITSSIVSLVALLGNILVTNERFLSYPTRYAFEPTLLVSRLTPLSVLRHLIFFILHRF